MPLIKSFKSTNIFNAFVLNSLRASIVIILTIAAKDHFDKYVQIEVEHDSDDNNNHTVVIRQTNLKSLIISFVVAFSVSMIAFILLNVVFGYGGGLLTNEQG
tara:strand:+ start:203 stop:508 length:306 start_codon:yes stop_codon:yes gene_type:complete